MFPALFFLFFFLLPVFSSCLTSLAALSATFKFRASGGFLGFELGHVKNVKYINPILWMAWLCVTTVGKKPADCSKIKSHLEAFYCLIFNFIPSRELLLFNI